MSTTMFKRTPSQVYDDIIEVLMADLVPFVSSSPGLGKSNIYAQIAKNLNLKLIDIRLSQCAPEDLMGLPMRLGEGANMKAAFAPFEMFPTADTPIPDGYNGWLLLLDEFNSASKMVEAAAYKLILDRFVGQAKLHENCLCAAAGNLSTDRAIVNKLSTASQSRLIHIEMVADLPDFMAHAVKAHFDHRILGFLEFQPSKLHAFKPDHNDRTFACPRTWEFASKLIKNKPFEKINLALLAGTLSDGVAVEFHTFLQEYEKLPSYTAILNSPINTPIPPDPSTRYALVTMLLERFNEDEFPDMVAYIKRLPSEFQVIYFRGVNYRHPNIQRHNKTFRDNIRDLTRFLNDTSDDQIAA